MPEQQPPDPEAPAAGAPASDIHEPIGPEAMAQIRGESAHELAQPEAQAPELAAGMRVMLDSAAPGLIPGSAPMVAGYVDGHFAWLPEEWHRFDGRPRVHITVEPFNRLGQPTGYRSGNFHEASVIDHETGAFTISDTVRFVPARNSLHPGTATIYTDEADLGSVLRANRAHGQGYWLWLAWYIGRVPTADDLRGVLGRMAGFKARLAAWQHTPGPRFDTSAVVAADWHPEHPKAGR